MSDHTQEHEQTTELMPGYALGILTDDERQLVERHIGSCPPCQDELENFKETAGLLPDGIQLYEPPAGLKARIMQKAVGSRQGSTVLGLVESAESRDSKVGRFQGEGQAPAVESTEGYRKKGDTAASKPRPWMRIGISAFAMALIAVLAVSNVLLWMRLDQLESSSTLRTIALYGTESAPQSIGTMVISLDGEHGTLVVDALPVLEETQEYQLWLMKDGVRVSGGVFSVSKDGYGAVWVHAPDPLASYETAGVTIEPAGGSPDPTGLKVLGGDL